MRPIDSPKTSVSNRLTPRNNPEDGRIRFTLVYTAQHYMWCCAVYTWLSSYVNKRDTVAFTGFLTDKGTMTCFNIHYWAVCMTC